MKSDEALPLQRLPRDYSKRLFLNNEKYDGVEAQVKAFKQKPPITEEAKSQLLDACIAGDSEKAESIIKRFYLDVQTITGKMEQIQVGNTTIQSENLNILHLAVYNANLEVVRVLCENIPTLDLAQVGKIPESSGLINQSEISISEENEDNPFVSVGTNKGSLAKIIFYPTHYCNHEFFNLFEKSVSFSKIIGGNHQPTKVRSLILFWSLDSGNMEMLRYLWTFDDFMPTKWGVKNLEFMLILANDLSTQDMDDSYPIEELFSILLEPKPFSTVMRYIFRSLPSMSLAMEFIEDHVIKNSAIDHNLKLQLLYAPEMAPFSFLNPLSSLLLFLIVENPIQFKYFSNFRRSVPPVNELLNQFKHPSRRRRSRTPVLRPRIQWRSTEANCI